MVGFASHGCSSDDVSDSPPTETYTFISGGASEHASKAVANAASSAVFPGQRLSHRRKRVGGSESATTTRALPATAPSGSSCMENGSRVVLGDGDRDAEALPDGVPETEGDVLALGVHVDVGVESPEAVPEPDADAAPD